MSERYNLKEKLMIYTPLIFFGLLFGGFAYWATHIIYFLIAGGMITALLIDLGRRWRKTLPPLPDEDSKT